jgi:hypothetical protein
MTDDLCEFPSVAFSSLVLSRVCQAQNANKIWSFKKPGKHQEHCMVLQQRRQQSIILLRNY